MTKDINEIKLEEKVRSLLLKYHGDVNSVASEANVSLPYVLKVAKKFKKSLTSEINDLIATSISREIVFGRKQRIHFYIEMLKSLDKREQPLVCLDCGMPVRENVVDGVVKYYCIKEDKEVKVRMIDRVELYELKIKILNELRSEDEKLVEWMTKMGFTGIQPSGPSTVFKQTQIFVGDNSKKLKAEDLASDISKLSPLEAEKIIKALEKQIENAVIIEDGNKIEKSEVANENVIEKEENVDNEKK